MGRADYRKPDVPCLPAEQQVYFHQDYERSERDRHDMAQLRRVFGIATHS
ncbi:nucleotidyltransferase domain-containing protein [Streptomyces mirabilis]